MEPLTLDTSPPHEGMTAAQLIIINKFATIQAELECLLRETKRTRFATLTNKARREHDRREQRLFPL